MARVYQSSDGKWIVFSGGIKTYFLVSEELEARIMASKIMYSSQAQGLCTRLAQIFLEAKDLDGVYFDEGFDGAGSGPITDVDISSLGIKASDVEATVTMLQQLQNFEGNTAVTAGDYGSTVNRMRTDV